MNFTIRPTESHHESVHKTVLEALIVFNDANVGESGYRPIAFAIEDERGQMMGGLSAATAYGWLFVELLFVPEAARPGRRHKADPARRSGSRRARMPQRVARHV